MTDLPVLRQLDYGPGAAVHELGAAGLQAILDGGDVEGWRPVLRALARDPWGPVAVRVERVLDHLETYGTARLLRQWLRNARAGTDRPAATLADLRREAGLSHRELAARLGARRRRSPGLSARRRPARGRWAATWRRCPFHRPPWW